MEYVHYRSVPNFYQQRAYASLHQQSIGHAFPDADVRFSSKVPEAAAQLTAEFDRVTFERAGLMRGEYGLPREGMALIAPDGTFTKINIACEDIVGDHMLNYVLTTPDMMAIRQQILDHWSELPVFEDVGIVSDIFSGNYYHSTLEMMPRLRLLLPHCSTIFLPRSYLARPHILHLVGQLMPKVQFVSPEHAIRVKNPLVAHDQISASGLHWLRSVAGLRAVPGTRRIFIRRSRTSRGGGLEETAAFLTMLQQLRFETLDFGQGEMTLAEQVRLLDGAGLIIAPHGAGLTNLVYLDPPVRIVEFIPLAAARTMYAELCAALGFAYRGIITTAVTDMNEQVVDMEELRQCLFELAA